MKVHVKGQGLVIPGDNSPADDSPKLSSFIGLLRNHQLFEKVFGTFRIKIFY